jgi:selenocysteine lyase/cysteine desulfurase
VQLDLDFVRSNFPAFARPINDGQSFFENAGGSFACRQTIDALTEYYTDLKVQPYSEFESSRRAGELMDRSRERWAEALGVQAREVVFGPSTSANTYVLAHAFADVLEAGNEVIVTNQDHEANTGAIRRAAERLGCTVKEWTTDPETGLLDIDQFEALLSERTGLVTVPHASNIIGSENDVASVTRLAHGVGARVIVDGVSFAPHTIPDVGAIGADVYLFSLYKTYSVHQGLMVARAGLMAELPNQSHFFNDAVADKRLNPAGPDHAQVASAGAVLDYVEALHRHHGGASTDDLRAAVGRGVEALARPRGRTHAPAAPSAGRTRRRAAPRAGHARRRRGPSLSDDRVQPARARSPAGRPRAGRARRPDQFGALLRGAGARRPRPRPRPGSGQAVVRALHLVRRCRPCGECTRRRARLTPRARTDVIF